MKLVQQEAARLKALETKRNKFVISAWRFSLYTTTAAVSFFVLSREPGAFDPQQFFNGWPEQQHMSASLKFLYQFAFGSYMYQTVDTLFVAPKQKDFVAMTVHHIVTLSLIYFSYLWGFYRIGVMVFLVHEVADPFLELAKCFLYCGFQQVADVLFAMFAGVFIYSRVVYFPFYIISSVPLYAYHEDGQIIPFGRKDVNYTFVALLSMLEVLHVYWSSIVSGAEPSLYQDN
ncbi:TRAM/LAG1/CLN8 homology domain-containing protein [Cladochytrium replicatum]|nr:TRAM/LAG1/CLN8 homology domain-containing protein [Cladochytrium replicatum]